MIIERNISKYIVFYEDPLIKALEKISHNKSRIIFSVKEDGVLEGVLSDGDLRRWLIERKEIDLNPIDGRFVFKSTSIIGNTLHFYKHICYRKHVIYL